MVSAGAVVTDGPRPLALSTQFQRDTTTKLTRNFFTMVIRSWRPEIYFLPTLTRCIRAESWTRFRRSALDVIPDHGPIHQIVPGTVWVSLRFAEETLGVVPVHRETP